jgi:ABC-type nitrate/sulfonate/bicarbonate transport system substrate-binding protein
MIHRRFLAITALAFSVVAAHGSASAEPSQTAIRTAYQPGRWWLEVYLGEELGWFQKMGLSITGSSFSNGAVEIAAGASGSWDIGGAGNIPAVLGAARYGLQSIAIADREELVNTVMALPDKADAYLKNPLLLKGKTIPITTNSTGHWTATECLKKKFGLATGDWQFVNLAPPEINAAISSGRYDVAQVWAPHIYVLEATINAKVICTAKDVGLTITSNVFVTPNFAKDHPDAVAKFLAVYLHAVAWERLHPSEAEKHLLDFYRRGGVQIPSTAISQELHNRPAFDLSQQLSTMKRDTNGTSEFDHWMSDSAEFMKSVGMIAAVPEPKAFITDRFLLMIENDPQLRSFALDGNF